MERASRKQFDVALSFAGEDRPYVSQVAEYVKKRGLNVFYDSFFEVELWGKDLIVTLDNVYRNEAQFVVIFISSAYVKKEWTNFERRSALAAAIKSSSEYVLPVRFDDTDLPGLPPTIAYKDAREFFGRRARRDGNGKVRTVWNDIPRTVWNDVPKRRDYRLENRKRVSDQ